MAGDVKKRFRQNLEPLVSVICITRNHERFCIESLDSVLNQTYKNIEWIILDAASTDSTVVLIDNWLVENNVQAVFLKEKELKTITVNLNKALAYAHGEYVQFLSLDDLLMSEKLEYQVKTISNKHDLGLILSNAIKFDGYNLLTVYTEIHGEDFENYLNHDLCKLFLEHNYFCAPGALCRLEALIELGGFDEGLYIDDTDMWYRFCKSRWIVKYNNKILVKYRVHADSMWRNVNHRVIIGYFQFYLKHGLVPHEKILKAYFEYFSSTDFKDRLIVIKWLFKNRSFYFLIKYGIFNILTTCKYVKKVYFKKLRIFR